MTRSVHTAPDTVRPIHNARDAREFASYLIHTRAPDAEFDARAVLGEYPELSAYDAAVLDIIYEEYSRRAATGTPPDPQQFVKQFPKYRSVLLEHISAHGVLERCYGGKEFRWPTPGETVLGCRLEEEIGRGIVSRVFLARQAALGDRRVVVKFCPYGAHEAQLLGKLQHELIVEVHAVHTDAARGLTVLVMPFLGRATLEDVVLVCFGDEEAPRSAARIVEAVQDIDAEPDEEVVHPPTHRPRGSYIAAVTRLMLDVARGLAHAHSHGVLHADIKPSNVLVTGNLRAKLLDFNLSRDTAGRARFTGGTVPYMAPEQLLAIVQGHDPAPTIAADIHAFGATFYECLSGASPYGGIPAGLDRIALARRLLDLRAQGLVPLRRVAPQTPRAIARLVDCCLAFDPRERPALMQDVAAVLAREQYLTTRLLRWIERRPRLVTLSCAGALLMLASGWAWTALADPQHVIDLASARRAALSGETVRAEELYGTAAAALPVDADPHLRVAMLFERGRVRLRLGTLAAHDGAYADFMQVLEIDPGHAAARASAGYARIMDLMSERESVRSNAALIARSLDDFEQALQAGLETPELRFDIACCQLAIGNETERAVQNLLQLRSSLAPNGDTGDVYLAVLVELARLEFLRADRSIAATSYSEDAAGLAPDCGEILELAAATMLRRAAIEQAAGDADAASDSLNRAADYFHRAARLGVIPERLEALRSLNPAASKDPRFEVRAIGGPRNHSVPPPSRLFDPLRSLQPDAIAIQPGDPPKSAPAE